MCKVEECIFEATLVKLITSMLSMSTIVSSCEYLRVFFKINIFQMFFLGHHEKWVENLTRNLQLLS